MENGKWNKLTELFIQEEIYYLIHDKNFPAETKANNLAELWKLKKDAGLGNYSKYTTVKDFYNGEKENINYDSIEDFVDYFIIYPLADYLVREELNLE